MIEGCPEPPVVVPAGPAAGAPAGGWDPELAEVLDGCLEELAMLAPGPELAARLAAVDRSALSLPGRLRLAQARQRLIAHEQAQLLADLYSVASEPPQVAPLPGQQSQHRDWVEAEIAFAMRWTALAAAGQVSLAGQLIEIVPAVHAALAAGHIDLPRARVLCDGVVGLSVATARRVVAGVIDQAPQLTTGQLRVRVRRAAIAADPQHAAAAVAIGLAGRRVELRAGPDHLAGLHGYDLPPHRAAAAMERLTAIAVAAKQAGDPRTVDRLRADALLDLLAGAGVALGRPVTYDLVCTHADELDRQDLPAPPTAEAASPDQPTPAAALPGPRRGVVEIQVSLATLVGLSQEPGELAGWGPVTADIARQVAAQQTDATWRFSVTNDLGEVIHHGITKRRPDAQTSALVRARNRTCVAPGCRRAARGCDLDHILAWSDGGHSGSTNLAPLCRRHHRLKHTPGVDLIQFSPGVFGWTTPLGLQYVTRPDLVPACAGVLAQPRDGPAPRGDPPGRPAVGCRA